MRQIVDCFAEYERAIIRARTRAALAVKKSRGQRVGGIPFGYRLAGDGRALEPHRQEQQALAVLRAAGYTYRAVAEELNRQGFRSRTGGPWVRQSVHVLTRVAYPGRKGWTIPYRRWLADLTFPSAAQRIARPASLSRGGTTLAPLPSIGTPDEVSRGADFPRTASLLASLLKFVNRISFFI